jgi:CheY-like chemotaxis protein
MTEAERIDDTSSRPEGRRPGDATVLVVDDEIDIATYLSSVLEDAGINVRVAYDGEQALEAIRNDPPDLISLDLVMPRKTGIRLLAELRRNQQWSRIPVIIVTAHARDPNVRSDLDDVLAESTMTGPSLYLEKPVTPRRYLESICKILGIQISVDPASGDSSSALRREASKLMETADAATLEAVLSQLRRGEDR